MPKYERDVTLAEKRAYCIDHADECIKRGTQWSQAFTFNAVILLISFFNFCLLMVGAFWFYPRIIGTIFNCCIGVCHLAAWVFALSVRYSALGRACVLNVEGNQYEGNSVWNDSMDFKKDGNILYAFATVQAILWCV